MASLAEAKKALQFNKEFTVLVDILKGIAASQFQSLMRKKVKFEKFTDSFDGFFRLMDFANIDSPFVRSQSDVTGILMVTSDEGFMGDLNMKVIEAALKEAGPGPKEIYITGVKGLDILQNKNLQATSFPPVEFEKRYEQSIAIKDKVVADVASKKIGRLIVSYPFPVSFTVQKPVVVHMLPCAELFEKPPEEKSPQPPFEKGGISKEEVILESRPEKLIQSLVGMWITYRLYDFFMDSRLAEFAAKTISLEQSFDRLAEQGKKLKYAYFRARRELIDKGTRETFASILLRRKFEGA